MNARDLEPGAHTGGRLSDYKGTGILFLRQRARDAGRVQDVLRFLGEGAKATGEASDQSLFEETMAGTWVSMRFADRAWVATAKALYPDIALDDGLRELGRLLAHDHLKGVYAFIARATSFRFVLSRAAVLHRTYHSRGNARVLRSDAGVIEFVIADYPDLPPNFRIAMCGWCDGAGEVCKESFEPFVVRETTDAESASDRLPVAGWLFSTRQSGT